MGESNNSMNISAPFLTKTYDMVDDPSTNEIVSWSGNDTSFIVWNVPDFEKILLPKFFKHNNFSSFVRQLNTYGFRKIDPDRWEFANDGFLRGQRHLLKGINRRKPVHGHTHSQLSSIQNPSNKACVEVGKFGLEEEVDRLKRDKNVLMQELVRLRQQQQSTDNQLQSAGQRVQVMEQRQQQMMSFLAKAMQRPGFLAQVVQQKNDGNRHVTGVNKKRRLPNNDEENVEGVSVNGSFSDGRIVKYQPLINEAGKSMLREILKLSDPLHDQSLKDPNAFLLDHIPATSNAIDCSSSSTRSSGVTLSEVPQCSKEPIFPEEMGYAMNSEMHSSHHEQHDDIRVPAGDLRRSQEDAIMLDSNEVAGILSQNSFDMSIYGAQNPDLGFMDVLSAIQNGTLSTEGEVYSPGRLPVSVDKFWEQFFTMNSLPENQEEVDSSKPEASIARELGLGQDEEWGNHHPMNHLSEQMGLLTAEPERV